MEAQRVTPLMFNSLYRATGHCFTQDLVTKPGLFRIAGRRKTGSRALSKSSLFKWTSHLFQSFLNRLLTNRTPEEPKSFGRTEEFLNDLRPGD